MKFEWKRYKKLVPAVIGIGLLLSFNYLKIERIPGLDAVILEWLIGGATVFGIYQAKNIPPATEEVIK
jgi:hypothetical protein